MRLESNIVKSLTQSSRCPPQARDEGAQGIQRLLPIACYCCSLSQNKDHLMSWNRKPYLKVARNNAEYAISAKLKMSPHAVSCCDLNPSFLQRSIFGSQRIRFSTGDASTSTTSTWRIFMGFSFAASCQMGSGSMFRER